MKGTILAALLTSSVFWSGMPGRPSCGTLFCLPVRLLAIVGQMAVASPDELLTGPTWSVDPRDCVGVLRREPAKPPMVTGPLMLVTSGLPHWA